MDRFGKESSLGWIDGLWKVLRVFSEFGFFRLYVKRINGIVDFIFAGF